MTTELLKQARDALAKSEPTGIYKNSMTAAKRHENLIKEIDAALAQPADEDAWLEKAVDIAQEFDDRAFRADTEIQLRAHLRARPAREGFVSVPVEPVVMTSAALDDLLYPAMCGWDNSDIPLEQYSERIWEILRHHGFSICAFGDVTEQAMIAAAKGGGK